jgi:hypothetical protein
VRTVTVYVNGRRAKRVRGYRKAVRVRLPARKSGRSRVVVVVRGTRAGRLVTLRVRRTYRVCG